MNDETNLAVDAARFHRRRRRPGVGGPPGRLPAAGASRCSPDSSVQDYDRIFESEIAPIITRGVTG